MSDLSNLDNLGYLGAQVAVKQKHQMTTTRQAKAGKDKTFTREWEACKKEVDRRDGMVCRICGRKTKRCLDRVPGRHEHAHIKGRNIEPALVTDARNVFAACGSCHDDFDAHKIEGLQPDADRFAFEGRRLVNAYNRIEFVAA